MIEFPKRIGTNIGTIRFFNEMLSFENYKNEVYFKMHDIEFFDSSMTTYFMVIIDMLFERYEKITYDGMQFQVEDFFIKNGFAKYLSINETRHDINKTMIPFTVGTSNEYGELNDDDLFEELKKIIKEKKLLNLENNILHTKLLNNIGELFNNGVEHGESDRVYLCGQYYPKLTKLSFSVSNRGKTIREKVLSKHVELYPDECLKWALKKGNSTRENGIGGSGLAELKLFVEDLSGKMVIISGDGMLVLTSGNRYEGKYYNLPNYYKGTSVLIDILYDRYQKFKVSK